MGAPGYFLINIGDDGEPTYDDDGDPIVINTLIELPIQSRIGVEYGTEYHDALMETERGRRWVYPQFERQIRRMVFRLTLAQLAAFETLDTAVGGQRDPFMWVLDTDVSPTVRIFVRKEASFIVRQVENYPQGGLVDYELILSEEPTGPEITD